MRHLIVAPAYSTNSIRAASGPQPEQPLGTAPRLSPMRVCATLPSISSHRRHLERHEEQELARRWHDLGDRAAIDALVTSHLGLAIGIARRYRGPGRSDADLASEAALGLLTAAIRFQAGRGARFSTYARWWIRYGIREYLIRSWSLVRIGTTTGQRRLFFSLRREMRRFADGDSTLTPQLAAIVAKELGVPSCDVIEMNSRLAGDFSLNAAAGSHDGGEWQDLLVDHAPDPEAIVAENDESSRRVKALHEALGALTARERTIFTARRLTEDPPTLEQLAHKLALSSERVRQIELSAFEKVRRAAKRSLSLCSHHTEP